MHTPVPIVSRTRMGCLLPIRIVAVVKKKTLKWNLFLLTEHPVGSLFVLQCQREDTGDICPYKCAALYFIIILHISVIWI